MLKNFLGLFILFVITSCQDNITSTYDNTHDYRSENYVPDKPSDLKIISYSDSIVSLKWKDLSMNESGFEIEMKVSDPKTSTSFGLIGKVGNNIDLFNYKYNFIAGTTYYFRVRAYFKNNYSTYASPVYLKP